MEGTECQRKWLGTTTNNLRANSMLNVFEVASGYNHLANFTTELYPGILSLTFFNVQDTGEDNNGLPVVVDSYLCFTGCMPPKTA